MKLDKKATVELPSSKLIVIILVVIVIALTAVVMFNPDMINYLRGQPGYGTPDDKDIVVSKDIEVPVDCPVRVGVIKGAAVYRCINIKKVDDTTNPGQYCGDDKAIQLVDNLEFKDTQDAINGFGSAVKWVSDVSAGTLNFIVSTATLIGTFGSGSVNLGLRGVTINLPRGEYVFAISGDNPDELTQDIIGSVSNNQISMDLGRIEQRAVSSRLVLDSGTLQFLSNLHKARRQGNWICRDNVIPPWQSSDREYRFGDGWTLDGGSRWMPLGPNDYYFKELVVDSGDARLLGAIMDTRAKDPSIPYPQLTQELITKYSKSKGFDGIYYYRTMDIVGCKGLGDIQLYIDGEEGKELAESYLDKDGNLVSKTEKNGKKYMFFEYSEFKKRFDNKCHWDFSRYGGFAEDKWIKLKDSEVIPNDRDINQLTFPTGGYSMKWAQWNSKDVDWGGCRNGRVAGKKVFVRFASDGTFSWYKTPRVLMDWVNWYLYDPYNAPSSVGVAFRSLLDTRDNIHWLLDESTANSDSFQSREWIYETPRRGLQGHGIGNLGVKD